MADDGVRSLYFECDLSAASIADIPLCTRLWKQSNLTLGPAVHVTTCEYSGLSREHQRRRQRPAQNPRPEFCALASLRIAPLPLARSIPLPRPLALRPDRKVREYRGLNSEKRTLLVSFFDRPNQAENTSLLFSVLPILTVSPCLPPLTTSMCCCNSLYARNRR